MTKLLLLLTLGLLSQACDTKLNVKVGNLPVAPEVSTTASLDGYSSAFTPDLEVKDEYETVVWVKKSGPGLVVFSDPTILKPEIYADMPGDYILTVTITNKRGISTETEYQFTWYNAAPGDFAISSPTNTVSTLKPNITWQEADDLNDVTYTVTIFKSDCSTIHQQKSGLTDVSYNLVRDLTNSESYCVSVIAIDAYNASTKASNDKALSFSVNTTSVVSLSGGGSWANEASDGYIKFGEEASTNPVASFSGSYTTISYTSLLDETSTQTCDGSQTYDQSNIPLINSISIDRAYSICAKLEAASVSPVYIKSSTNLVRDVVAPSVTSDVVIDVAGIFADGNLTAAEYNAGTNVITTDVVAVGADVVGYSFVANGDACSTVTSYKDPLMSNDSSIGSNGTYKICTKLQDFAGNEIFDEISPAVPIVIDRDSPAISTVTLLNEAADNYINATENANATPIVSHDGSGGDTTEYEIVGNGHSCAAAAASAWSTSVPAANGQTTEGDYKICVKISDALNSPAVMASSVFTIDKTAPTINAGSALAANTATALSPSLGDATSLTWTAPTEVSFSNANLATSNVSASTDGAYAVVLTASDAAGNSATDSFVFTWDTTPPTVNVGGDITIGSAIAVDASVTGGATTFAWTKQSGTGNITFGTPAAEDSTISADTDDSYVIRLTAQDALGNTAWDELTFTWNSTVVSVNVGSDLAVKTAAEAAITPTVSGEGGSPTYLWSKVSGPGTLTFAPNASTKDLTGITASTDGTYVVRLSVTNTGNSSSDTDDLTLVRDTSVPTITNVDAAGDITGSATLNTSERTQTNALINNVSGSGQDTIEYTVTTNATACSAATGYSASVPLSNDARITTDGAYKVCVKFTDNANNTPAYDDSVTFSVDTSAPTSNSISIDADATYDTDGSVNLTLASTGASEMKVSNAADCSTGSYEAYGTSKNGWTLAQTNSTATVYVMFKDSAGNESTCISDTIIHDDQAPTVPTISIAGAAAYTTTTNISLSLSATDASHMYITNTAGCASGGTEEAYATTKAWTLGQTNGTATVYVRYRDLAGNWTSCENDTITHDNNTPALSISNSGWVNASNYTAYVVTGACNENGQSVTIGGTVAGSGTCNGTSYTATIDYTAITDGASAISITADMDDSAGNSATQATATLGKDIIAPAVALTNTGWINAVNVGAYNLTGTCTDAVSGAGTVSIGGTASASGACGGGTFTISADYSGASDGTNNISVTADLSDAAGNAATQDSITPSRDIVAPTLSISNSGWINAGNVAAYSVNGTCSDATSGVTSQNVNLTGTQSGTGACNGTTYSTSLDYSAAAEGSNNTTINADITDVAGNPATQQTVTLSLDKTAPAPNSIVIDSSATHDTDGSVDLTLASTDTNTLEMKISNTADCSAGTYEAFSTTKNGWTHGVSNGTATVSAIYRDAAGNESSCVSDTIVHDNTAPTGASISIAGAATHTATDSITLTLGATGASHMYITNTAGCASGGTEEAYSTSKAWTLGQTNGTATVYVKFRDLAGNESACIDDTIIHDDNDPTVTITNSGWVNASNYTAYSVTGACSEASRTVTIGGSVSGSGSCNGTSYTATINYTAVADGASAISITADISDLAGNNAAQASATLSKDIVAPSLSISDNGAIILNNESAYTVQGGCSDATSSTTSQSVSIAGSIIDSITCNGTSFSKSIA